MDNIEHIEWSGRTWLTRERWGSWHSGKPWNWYDMGCVSVKDGSLILSVSNNPRIFNDGVKDVVSNFGIGIVSSIEEFGFGYFEIEAKLPSGDGMWPAFWMYPPEHWPHEIDVFEGYSRKCGYRGFWLKPWLVESCIHREDNMGLCHVRARSPWRWNFNKNPMNTFNKYGCLWLPDVIEWFINGKSVRKVADKALCSYMSEYRMHVIINTHIDGNFVNDFTYDKNSVFIIKYFKYISV